MFQLQLIFPADIAFAKDCTQIEWTKHALLHLLVYKCLPHSATDVIEANHHEQMLQGHREE